MRSNILRILLFAFVYVLCSKYQLCYATEREIPLSKIAKLHNLKTVSSSVNKYTLRGNGIEFTFKNLSRTFLLNNIITPLGNPIKYYKQQLFISYSDYVTHILPFFTKIEKPSKNYVTIILDPGHGGHDNGAISSSGIKEKDIALDICKKIADKLTKLGYKVFLTRNSDSYVSLKQRTNIANQKKASVFVSIHCNSAESKSANGIETFTLTPYGQPSHNKAKVTASDLKHYQNNKFDKSNLLLAFEIQKTLILQLQAIDRGIKHSRFIVLKDLNCPGVLVECGFLSHVDDRQKLSSNQYRQELSEAIANGILRFLH